MYTCHAHLTSYPASYFIHSPFPFRSSNTMCHCYIMGLGMRGPNLALKSECASFSTQVEGKPPQSFSHEQSSFVLSAQEIAIVNILRASILL